MTTFFDKAETFINKSITNLGVFIRRTQNNTEGWGTKVDAWFDDPNKWEKLKTNVARTPTSDEPKSQSPEAGFHEDVLAEDTKDSDEFICAIIPPAPYVEDSLSEGLDGLVEQESLESLTLPELKVLAKERGFSGVSSMRKQELIDLLS